MASEAFITNIVTIVILVILVGTFALPKKIRYAVHAIFLFALGISPLLFSLGVIGFTFGEAGIIKYVVAVVVVFTARSLIAEGVKEKGALRWVSVIAGIVIIILAVTPRLYQLGALTFTIPSYPPLIDQIVYVIAAVLLTLGIFLSHD